MHVQRMFIAVMFGVAAPAWAQSASPSLNLELPATTSSPLPNETPPPAPTSEPITTTASAPTDITLPQPYDTTYGDRRDATQEGCDDKTYAKPEVHGSLGMGVAASKRASANYETAELDASKALGSCDDPKGEVRASIRVTQSRFNFTPRRGP